MSEKVDKMIKDYIRKEVKKELDKRYNSLIVGKVTNFTINWKTIDSNLLPIALRDLQPQDRKITAEFDTKDTLTFLMKKGAAGVPPMYITFRGTKFTSYNRAHFLDSEPEYITTSIAVDPEKCGWSPRKKKAKPRFTPAQRKAMK